MNEETPIKMLKADHRKVEQLFEDFYDKSENDDKKEIEKKIFKELEVHMQLEEQMFYPEVKKVSQQGEQMGQHAESEHQKVKEMINDLKDGDDVYPEESKMREINTALAEHIQDEEEKIFPFAEKNLEEELGMGFAAKMLALKEKLKMQK